MCNQPTNNISKQKALMHWLSYTEKSTNSENRFSKSKQAYTSIASKQTETNLRDQEFSGYLCAANQHLQIESTCSPVKPHEKVIQLWKPVSKSKQAYTSIASKQTETNYHDKEFSGYLCATNRQHLQTENTYALVKLHEEVN